jgi:hypothetical protein
VLGRATPTGAHDLYARGPRTFVQKAVAKREGGPAPMRHSIIHPVREVPKPASRHTTTRVIITPPAREGGGARKGT